MAISKTAVRKELKRFGLAAYDDLVLDALEPAVRLFTGKPVKKPLPVGSSKFGGEPDLPQTADWPLHASGRPMKFLGQICLHKLPATHLRGTSLPLQGWLWFWWDELGRWLQNNTRLSADTGEGSFQVTFCGDRRMQLATRPFPAFPEPNVPSLKKLRYYRPPTFVADAQVPILAKSITTITRAAREKLFKTVERDDAEKGWQRAYEFYRSIHLEKRREPKHRLLGDCFENEWPPKKPWRLLALFDSNLRGPGWMWGDAGELQFWIREQDLAKKKFSKVKGFIDFA